MYQERTYRDWVKSQGWFVTQICQAESDLLISAPKDVAGQAEELLREVRWDLEGYLRRDEKFLTSRVPHRPLHDAPLVAFRMAWASCRYGVGPMAAVAGAVADWVGEQLVGDCGQVVVENGGDIFLRTEQPLTFGLYAGEQSPFTGRLKYTLAQNGSPLGVCTSSGTVGHSYSQGKADAVCVIAKQATLADAAATAFCNCIQHPDDIQSVLDRAVADPDILGILVTMWDRMGVWGCVELV